MPGGKWHPGNVTAASVETGEVMTVNTDLSWDGCVMEMLQALEWERTIVFISGDQPHRYGLVGTYYTD